MAERGCHSLGRPSNIAHEAPGEPVLHSKAACPGCGQLISTSCLNSHLDNECSSRPQQAKPAPSGPAGGDAAAALQEPQPSPNPVPSTAGPSEAAGPAQASEAAAGAAQPAREWWKERREPTVATARLVGGRGYTHPLTRSDLLCACHCELLRGALPGELAGRVLEDLAQRSQHWGRATWNFNGVPAMLHHASERIQLGGPQEHGPSVKGVEPLLERVAALVQEPVNRRIRELQGQTQGGRSAQPLVLVDDLDRQGWASSYIEVNRYKDGSEFVGPHSDRLTSLGPLPIIASVSLGATRTFCLHRTQLVSLGGGAAAPDSAAERVLSSIKSVRLTLSHGDLLIMWPPMQECWKHEILASSEVARHPISGTTRMCLTFRREKAVEGVPLCHCGRRAILKAKAPRQQGQAMDRVDRLRYCYLCDTSQAPTCNFYRTASHVVDV